MIRSFTLLTACFVTSLVHAVSVTASVQPAHCGLDNGSAYANATGGLPPYAYSWSNGSTTANISGLAPGDYTVTVTDGLTNTAQATVTVEAVNELAQIWYEQRSDCNGQCGGIVSFDEEALGGTAPYTYDDPWVIAGPFGMELHGVCSWQPTSLLITDVNGCSATFQVSVGDMPIVDHQALNVTPECAGESNGTVTMDGGWWGMGLAYWVQSNDGGTFSQYYDITEIPFTITGLPAGDYWVQPVVPDGGGGYTYPYCEMGPAVTIELIQAPCGSVSGRLFNDSDQDCAQDNGMDIGLPYRVLTIEPGPQFAISSAQGDFFTALPDGDYTIAQPMVSESQLCPANIPTPFTIDLVTPNVVVDFADSSLVQFDLATHLWQHQAARPGFDFHMHGSVSNVSAYPGGDRTVTMNYDPTVTPTSISPTPSSVVVGTIQWGFPPAMPYEGEDFHVRFSVPADITLLGQVLDFTLSETNTSTETNDLNNTASVPVTIVGSYDPNDKTARTSSGLSNNSYFLDEDQFIDYTIRYQNTGTAFAQNVVVRDSLEVDLDPTTLEIFGASHAFVPSFENGRTLVFNFEDINLPDSGANEAASHGSIHFRIRPRADITVGEVVSNTVGIYFDLNPPVITNTSELVVEFSTQVRDQELGQLRVFPNPASDVVRITLAEAGAIRELRMYSTDGREVSRFSGTTAAYDLDLSSLSAGAYVVRAFTTGAIYQAHLIKR